MSGICLLVQNNYERLQPSDELIISSLIHLKLILDID